MSRLDDIERRLAALESAGGNDSLAPRVVALEECLGLNVGQLKFSEAGVVEECPRCKMMQNAKSAVRCPQGKCPLK